MLRFMRAFSAKKGEENVLINAEMRNFSFLGSIYFR